MAKSSKKQLRIATIVAALQDGTPYSLEDHIEKNSISKATARRDWKEATAAVEKAKAEANEAASTPEVEDEAVSEDSETVYEPVVYKECPLNVDMTDEEIVEQIVHVGKTEEEINALMDKFTIERVKSVASTLDMTYEAYYAPESDCPKYLRGAQAWSALDDYLRERTQEVENLEYQVEDFTKDPDENSEDDSSEEDSSSEDSEDVDEEVENADEVYEKLNYDEWWIGVKPTNSTIKTRYWTNGTGAVRIESLFARDSLRAAVRLQQAAMIKNISHELKDKYGFSGTQIKKIIAKELALMEAEEKAKPKKATKSKKSAKPATKAAKKTTVAKKPAKSATKAKEEPKKPSKMPKGGWGWSNKTKSIAKEDLPAAIEEVRTHLHDGVRTKDLAKCVAGHVGCKEGAAVSRIMTQRNNGNILSKTEEGLVILEQPAENMKTVVYKGKDAIIPASFVAAAALFKVKMSSMIDTATFCEVDWKVVEAETDTDDSSEDSDEVSIDSEDSSEDSDETSTTPKADKDSDWSAIDYAFEDKPAGKALEDALSDGSATEDEVYDGLVSALVEYDSGSGTAPTLKAEAPPHRILLDKVMENEITPEVAIKTCELMNKDTLDVFLDELMGEIDNLDEGSTEETRLTDLWEAISEATTEKPETEEPTATFGPHHDELDELEKSLEGLDPSARMGKIIDTFAKAWMK